MKKIFFSVVVILVCTSLQSQSIQDLRKELQSIISKKNATAGVSILGIESRDTLTINRNKNFPMMSVFKFHIALTVLNKVDKGELTLDKKILIKSAELLPETWSPMKEKYPTGDVTLTLDEILRFTVSHSDNNGCDILLRLLGGTKTVQKYINSIGIKGFVIKYNEEQMANWDNLYTNTTTPLATSTLLEKFYNGKVLKEETTKYLYQIMIETSRGLTWMKAGLPENTELAHRTGISGTNDANLRVALNDIGIFKLPNGQHVILVVYLKNITEQKEDTEKIIADITKATWNYFTSKKN